MYGRVSTVVSMLILCLSDLTPMKWWKGHNGYLGSNAANILKGSDGQQFHPSVRETDDLRFVRKLVAWC